MTDCKVENVVVAGKSGAGKQPRIDVLVEEFGLTQLSTGNIFREYLGAYKKLGDDGNPEGLVDKGESLTDDEIRTALADACEKHGVEIDSAVLGFKAALYVDQGLFVPDTITNALFEAAFRKADGRGLALDGYPRTTDQADFLLELAKSMGRKLDLIVIVDNEDEAIVARTTGRRICPNKACGKVFHLEFKPPRDGKFCTACGTEVILRSDDTEEKIRKRLCEFQDKAKPAVDALASSGIPVGTVPGNLPVFTDEAVRESVMTAIAPLI